MGLIKKNLTEPAVLIIISAFGIYLTSIGIRVEHIVVYGLCGISFMAILFRKKIHLPETVRFGYYFFVVFLIYSAMLWLGKGNAHLSGYIIGQMDRFILPVATITALSYFYRHYREKDYRILLNKTCEVLIIFSAGAAMLALIHMITNDGSFLQPFLPQGDAIRGTTASRSLAMGRYTGIFASPFDSGIVYSISLFSFFYLYINANANRYHYVMVIIIIFGALIAVSKAFMLGMILFFIAMIVVNGIKKMYEVPVFIVAIGVVGLFVFDEIFSNWDGLRYLMRLIPSGGTDDILRLYTANRFTADGEGTIVSRWDIVISAMPFGLGFSELGVVDNAYLEVALIAGILGLMFLLGFFTYYLWQGLKNYHLPEGKFLVLIIGYSFIASFGAPVITKNRYSVIFFTLFVLINFVINEQNKIKKINN
jgi:hypothetical protein